MKELGSAPVGKLLRRYAIPSIIAMTASSLYNMVDSIFIGRGVGAMALGGLAVTFPFMNLAAAFGALIGVGTANLISIKLGQKNYGEARRTLGNVVSLNVILGLLFMAVSLIWLDPILVLFGASDNTLQYAHDYMQIAIEEARTGIKNGHGGPFGAVIVKDGKIVSQGHNMVLKNNDATAHGEMMALRKAGEVLGTFDLSGCTLYTTGEPCHMCLCAIMWANIDKVYYGCTIADNGRIGFRDDKFNDIFGGRERLGDFLVEVDRDKCLDLFDEYNNMQHANY